MLFINCGDSVYRRPNTTFYKQFYFLSCMKNFRRQKTYGSYKVSHCPFCDKIATSKNEQGLDVCRLHTRQKIDEIKCVCGSWLETRSGKFGPYFNCVKCGNINYHKGLAMKELTTPTFQKEIEELEKETKKIKKDISIRKETIISSRDVEYFD